MSVRLKAMLITLGILLSFVGVAALVQQYPQAAQYFCAGFLIGAIIGTLYVCIYALLGTE